MCFQGKSIFVYVLKKINKKLQDYIDKNLTISYYNHSNNIYYRGKKSVNIIYFLIKKGEKPNENS